MRRAPLRAVRLLLHTANQTACQGQSSWPIGNEPVQLYSAAESSRHFCGTSSRRLAKTKPTSEHSKLGTKAAAELIWRSHAGWNRRLGLSEWPTAASARLCGQRTR